MALFDLYVYVSFIFSQIRMIIGTSIHCALGLIPDEVMEAAFVLPYHVPLPMAPAEGLLLVNSGYIFDTKQKVSSFLLKIS